MICLPTIGCTIQVTSLWEMGGTVTSTSLDSQKVDCRQSRFFSLKVQYFAHWAQRSLAMSQNGNSPSQFMQFFPSKKGVANGQFVIFLLALLEKQRSRSSLGVRPPQIQFEAFMLVWKALLERSANPEALSGPLLLYLQVPQHCALRASSRSFTNWSWRLTSLLIWWVCSHWGMALTTRPSELRLSLMFRMSLLRSFFSESLKLQQSHLETPNGRVRYDWILKRMSLSMAMPYCRVLMPSVEFARLFEIVRLMLFAVSRSRLRSSEQIRIFDSSAALFAASSQGLLSASSCTNSSASTKINNDLFISPNQLIQTKLCSQKIYEYQKLLQPKSKELPFLFGSLRLVLHQTTRKCRTCQTTESIWLEFVVKWENTLFMPKMASAAQSDTFNAI